LLAEHLILVLKRVNLFSEHLAILRRAVAVGQQLAHVSKCRELGVMAIATNNASQKNVAGQLKLPLHF
jgi:hypothetical protein